MGSSKKTVTVVSIAIVFAMALGIAIGATIKNKGNDHSNGVAVSDPNLKNETIEQLSGKLSNIMLPDDEFGKLGGAIFQTAMGLFMAQSQQAGIEATDAAQQELRKSIDDKYSRQYFADMNAKSMAELTQPDLVAIIGFYQTEAGQKFLKLSPKIIQSTMTAVQADLTQWLPKTVDALVSKLKGGAPSEGQAEPGKDPLQNQPQDGDKPAAGRENS